MTVLKESKTKRTAPPEEDHQFVFDKPYEKLTPKERSMSQLKRFTPEGRRLGRMKQLETQLLDKQLQKNFKRNAKAFSKVLKDIPEMSGIDVMKMCIHLALGENDWDTAAKWAKELAEYEKPKLQRVEKIVKDETKDMSDEELMRLAIEEGLLPSSATQVPNVNTILKN
jgi:hypothetical protein